jgi:hypothetical protein
LWASCTKFIEHSKPLITRIGTSLSLLSRGFS